jgi:hypothetical protein
MQSPKKVLADYLTEEDLMRELDVSVFTLRAWRKFRKGPPYSRIARKAFYPATEFLAWVKSLERQPAQKTM